MSIGERVKTARIMAGMDLDDLAHKAEVSATTISAYEQNLDIPNSTILIRLAQALNRKVEYFFRPDTVTLSTPSYGQHQPQPASQEACILAQVQEWLERYMDIEFILNRPAAFQQPIKWSIETLDDTEDAALALREQWQLGLDPIEGLIEICEDHGIKVGLIEAPTTFDSFTLYANATIPVIVLCSDMTGDQQRLCLVRELGHLFLSPTQHLNSEETINRFVRAFLVPSSVAQLELGLKRHTISFYELYQLKQKYGLSMQGWLQRAKDLQIISESAATQLFKQFRQHNWHDQEPGPSLPPEEPQRFQRLVMHALSERIILHARAAELLQVPVSIMIEGDVEGDGGISFKMCG